MTEPSRFRPLILSLGAWLVAAAVTAATSPGRGGELGEIRSQIGRLERQLARMDEESSSLETELARTEVAVRLQERQVKEVSVERRLAEEELELGETRAAVLESALEESRRLLRGRVVSLYRQDERRLVGSFLRRDAVHRVLEDLRLLRLATYRDAFAVDRYRVARRDLELQLEAVAQRREEVEELAARESARLERLERTRSLQRRALNMLRTRRETLAARASRLDEKAEKLSLLMELVADRGNAPPTGTPISEFRGALDWPIRGEILRGFGPRLDKRYKTRIPHNGIEIATAPGSDVKVVFPGVVVFAAPFEDSGLTVVVHHPQRVFSLYAGLESTRVQKGDVLSFAAVLGEVRSSMYFELRSDNRPQNPLSWLR